MNERDLKEIVKKKYGTIALQSEKSGCCSGASCCSDEDYSVFSESYQNQSGYLADADLGLGCGIPTDFADIQPGNHVLDLGSGAGNDCFVARTITGDKGRVTGLDFSEEMLAKARKNLQKLGYTNMEFVQGDIDVMPFADEVFDVIISNCVLNLVPDKSKAFSEMYRVLKTGGHFCVSDVVVKGQLPPKLKHDAEMYAGCVAGALPSETYLELIREAGFKDITVHKMRLIDIPETIIRTYLDVQELEAYQKGQTGLFSITVSGYKKV